MLGSCLPKLNTASFLSSLVKQLVSVLHKGSQFRCTVASVLRLLLVAPRVQKHIQ